MTQIRGLMYPLNVRNGRLSLSEDLERIQENIIEVLETRPFERVMRADYGFDSEIFSTLEPNAINARIWMAVTDQVPEVTDLQVDGTVADSENGLYAVKLRFSVNGVPAPPLSLTLNF